MWKRFLHGLMFGAGFTTGCALLWTVWVVWIWPAAFSAKSHSVVQTDNVTNHAPALVQRQEFLGSMGRYTGDFRMHEASMLVGDDAAIQGEILADGKPAKGLRIKLALNGSVVTQWGEVDDYGKYRVTVPAGLYRVDGYELDSSTAAAVLAGLTDSPENNFDQPEFKLAAGTTGDGGRLLYVKPVQILAPTGELAVTTDTMVRWHPYPGASKYRIQIEETATPKKFNNMHALFSWADRPLIDSTEFPLGEHAKRVQSGKQYTIHIQALTEDDRVLSESVRKFGKPHFKAI